MRLPNWVKRIGHLLGRAWYGFGQASRAFTLFKAISWLSALGLGSIVASLLAHVMAPFLGMPPGLRWVFFGGIGLLVVALVLGLAQWLALRYQPAWLTAGLPAKEPAVVSQRAPEADALEAKNRKLLEQVNNAQSHIKYVETVARGYHEELTFGQRLPEPQPLDPVDYRHMASGLHELRPSLKDTLAGTNAVWSHLSATIREQQQAIQWRMLAWRLDRVERTERPHFERAVNAFETVLETRDGDPRPYLAGVYITYRRWRDQIRDVGESFGLPVRLMNGAIGWHDAERRFLEILERKMATPELRLVKDAREAYDNRHGRLDEIFSA